MTALFCIIALHLAAILAGRSILKFNYRGITILILLTLLLVAIVMYMMFTMENPKVGNF